MHAGRECVTHTVAFVGALFTCACAVVGTCLRVPVYGRCGKRPSPMMGKKSAPKLEPVAPPLAVSCAPDAGARPVCKFPHRALCSLCASISAVVLRGRYVYGRSACVRCVPALATQGVCLCVCVCSCVTPHHFHQAHSVRYHTSPLGSSVLQQRLVVRPLRPVLPLSTTRRLCRVHACAVPRPVCVGVGVSEMFAQGCAAAKAQKADLHLEHILNAAQDCGMLIIKLHTIHAECEFSAAAIAHPERH